MYMYIVQGYIHMYNVHACTLFRKGGVSWMVLPPLSHGKPLDVVNSPSFTNSHTHTHTHCAYSLSYPVVVHQYPWILPTQ